MSEENTQSIEQSSSYAQRLSFLESGEKDTVAIICHDQPDPDCLACAMAFQEIAQKYGLMSRIYYGGEISHTQNRVMINVLNVPAQKLEDGEEGEGEAIRTALENSYIVLVDTAEFGAGPCSSITRFLADDRKPDLVIDHHELNPKIECSYIREPMGACSTILCKMLRELEIEIGKALATALYLGISTDTANLKAESVHDDDKAVFESLKGRLDPEAYEKILNYPRPDALIDMRRKAYRTLNVENTLAICNAGVVSTNQRSLLAELCDELLAVESVQTAVVMSIVDEGIKGKKALCASFRSRNLAVNMQEFISKTFGKKYGGGRRGAGAAKIPLDGVVAGIIDNIRQTAGDNGKLFEFTQPIFDVYVTKVREENSNI